MQFAFLGALAALSLIAAGCHRTPSAVATTTAAAPVPYTITLTPVDTTNLNLPALQSYCLAEMPQGWLITGGRINTGLHTFNTSGNNFPPTTEDPDLWWVDGTTHKAVAALALSALKPEFADPLMASNQECALDAQGNLYVIGGYGMDRASGKMTTFDSLIRVPAADIATIMTSSLTPSQKAAKVGAAMQQAGNIIHNSQFAVTGGALEQMPSGSYALIFGQNFKGEYNPFEQTAAVYTQQVRAFSVRPGTTQLLVPPYAVNQPNADFHRRDLNVVPSVNPATGQTRMAALGGVFQPGIIGAYDFPAYISESGGQMTVSADHGATAHQRFNQYECPVVVVYDPDGKAVYYTLFGGIGHYYYWQTPQQNAVYKEVTAAGRNDGMPFTEDITTLLQTANGAYQEWIAPQPIPGNRLDGASADFIPELAASQQYQGNSRILNLQSIAPGASVPIGYIYGGIEAQYPLPCVPSHGTAGTNHLYQVTITRTPWNGMIPAAQGHEATPGPGGPFNHESRTTTSACTPPVQK